MIGALIILAVLVAVGGVLYLLHLRDVKLGRTEAPSLAPMKDPPIPENAADDDSPCCGMHISCEKDSLLIGPEERAEYFDDEELDRFAGRSAEGYTESEVEEFRDVLLTLIPTEIAAWARSIQLRGIELPTDVRDELLMIVAEARAAANMNNSLT